MRGSLESPRPAAGPPDSPGWPNPSRQPEFASRVRFLEAPTRERFAGQRRRRVLLDRAMPVLQVVDTRYQAGRFGSGFKPRPKSDAGIREVPLAPLLVEAIRRQLPAGVDPDDLVFTGPGGGNGVAAGTRTTLSRHGFRR